MKTQVLLVLAGMFLTLSAWATPTVSFKWIANSNGDYQLAISGRDLCDSAKFKIRVTNMRSDDIEWYTSRAGKSEWPIENCGIKTMMLNKDVMRPGHVLEVRTYTYQGNKNHSFRKTIPCNEWDWGNAFSGQDIYDGTSAQLASCGNTPRPPVPPIPPRPQPPTQLECKQMASTIYPGSTSVQVLVSCNYLTPVRVSVRQLSSLGSPIGQTCTKFVNAQESPQTACQMYRDPVNTFFYQVVMSKVGSSEEILNDRGMVFKVPTYNYPPMGQIVSDRYLNPPSRPRILGNGKYWPFTVSVRVEDGDLNFMEQRKLIKVVARVSNSSGEKVLMTMYGNTGDTLSFELSHTFIDPIIFGAPRHSNEGFILGENKVTFEIYDAYDGMKPMRIADEVVVTIQ
jgi:hypothetical protein